MNLGGGLVSFLLLLFAFVCFVVAAWPMADPRSGRLGAWGLAFLTASMIVGRLGG